MREWKGYRSAYSSRSVLHFKDFYIVDKLSIAIEFNIVTFRLFPSAIKYLRLRESIKNQI